MMTAMHHQLFFSRDGQTVWEAWLWQEKNQTVWRSNWWFGTEYLMTTLGPVRLLLPTA